MFKLVVLFSAVALAAAKPGVFAPGLFAPGFAYGGAQLAYSSPLAYSTPLLTGPLSLAPGQPANILGADGRPLDTLEVNVAKAQHYAAKGYDGTGIHLLKKRSLGPLAVAAPFGSSILAPSPLSYHAPLTYHSPLAYNTPFAYSAPLTYGYGPSSLIRTW